MTRQKIVMELAKMLMPCYRDYGCMLLLQTENLIKYVTTHHSPLWVRIGSTSHCILPREWARRKLDFGKLRKEIGHIVNVCAECKPGQMPLQIEEYEYVTISLVRLYNVYQRENPDALQPPCEAPHCWVKKKQVTPWGKHMTVCSLSELTVGGSISRGTGWT